MKRSSHDPILQTQEPDLRFHPSTAVYEGSNNIARAYESEERLRAADECDLPIQEIGSTNEAIHRLAVNSPKHGSNLASIELDVSV